MNTSKMYRKFGEIWPCLFLRYPSRQTEKQTNNHTDTLITILCTPTVGVLINI